MNECIQDFREVWELLEKRQNRETKSYHELFLGEVDHVVRKFVNQRGFLV